MSPWVSVVNGGLRWSPVVSVESPVVSGVSVSPVVSGGLRWSLVVSCGLR